MDIVHLPPGRLTWAERGALRTGLFKPASIPPLRVVEGPMPMAYCAACAAPIDSGLVWHGQLAYCSVECSLGGSEPA